MLNKLKVIAIIPARGGSKRLPGKNIKNFHGKPLIKWSVEAALSCKIIDKVIVSSDCDDILEAASLPNVVAYKRMRNLAEDATSSIDVALDVLDKFKNYDLLVWLQPTSPLRTEVQITEALNFYSLHSSGSLVSVTSYDKDPMLIKKVNEENKLIPYIRNVEDYNKNELYALNGAIYINDIKELRKRKAFVNEETIAYKMQPEYSIDIDTEIDFEMAKVLYHMKS